ncbi:siderophore-interacting protein [Pseudonocardia pini]|uniref:siderophore-interacting protein n=1 Tax=Pseudonocardia pini TaxID=2758030 RepID=UPI0015F0C930|nr:siderophore-interacting protein [Pseudonocardia pini]
MPVSTEVVDLDVVATRRLSPSLVRVELRGAVPSAGVPDEACVLQFPEPGGGEPVEGSGRWYTVRRIDEAGLTVDIVLHPGGVGGEWAAVAGVGDRLRRTHGNSWFRRPEAATWQVLVGDVTALPAIGRIVDESPADLRTIVHVEVPDRADAQDLPGAEVTWHHTPGLARAGRLGEIVAGIALPEGPGYVYVAGEASATRAARGHLRSLGLPRGSYGVVGYWRADIERWNARLAESGVDTVAIYERALAAGRDEEEVRELYERGLAEAGL